MLALFSEENNTQPEKTKQKNKKEMRSRQLTISKVKRKFEILQDGDTGNYFSVSLLWLFSFVHCVKGIETPKKKKQKKNQDGMNCERLKFSKCTF